MSNLNQLRAIIVDDENMARENLKMLIEEFCPEIHVVEMAENITEAKRKILEFEPEVVFLDIRMPSGSEGFELLESIENINFQIVFVTAFKDYAIQALNVNAIHYILKPIDIDDLQNAVRKLKSYQESFEARHTNREMYRESIDNLTGNMLHSLPLKKLTLYHSKGFKIIDLSDIINLEAQNNYTLFYFSDGSEYIDSKTLKFYEDLLKSSGFMRVHKSHIIHFDHLKEYRSTDGHTAIMSNGNEVPISRSRLSEFLSSAKRLS